MIFYRGNRACFIYQFTLFCWKLPKNENGITESVKLAYATLTQKTMMRCHDE
ncbi:hypothetical protein MTBBW1_1670078 [Desulfamplus magnetovallimortis]|uniref:Uncharacterized protein n=1 Tax=Desulfamplus magnetovallimortis TaxID=1246637 RepID=A0A1W1H9C5_9BACT|nr:hypothetical protein MTBBW1_1670078 [Desulfamplus magnetovallimortis]